MMAEAAPLANQTEEADMNEAESIRAATEAQIAEIEREVKDDPLISSRLPLSSLEEEFLSDEVYKAKSHELGNRYAAIRKLRRDGNCFYRAFGFSYLEYLRDNPKEGQRFKDICERRKNDLIKLGYPEFTVDDFHEQFQNVVNQVLDGCSISDIEEIFNNQGYSDYLVVFLRLLVSGHLQRESEFFQNFIFNCASIKDFCSTEVEPMARESDHIHIIALTQAIEVGIRIEYLDRGLHGVNSHTFPEGAESILTLLYRPGHYDILYNSDQNNGTTNVE